MCANNQELVVDHFSDLSSALEPIHFRSLHFQHDLFLQVRILDDLVHSRSKFKHPTSQNVGHEHNPELSAMFFDNRNENLPGFCILSSNMKNIEGQGNLFKWCDWTYEFTRLTQWLCSQLMSWLPWHHRTSSRLRTIWLFARSVQSSHYDSDCCLNNTWPSFHTDRIDRAAVCKPHQFHQRLQVSSLQIAQVPSASATFTLLQITPVPSRFHAVVRILNILHGVRARFIWRRHAAFLSVSFCWMQSSEVEIPDGTPDNTRQDRDDHSHTDPFFLEPAIRLACVPHVPGWHTTVSCCLYNRGETRCHHPWAPTHWTHWWSYGCSFQKQSPIDYLRLQVCLVVFSRLESRFHHAFCAKLLQPR